jgi:GAF domain-containing protein/anti-sigma regulatory factor (Ser/Thr protein kinase)
LGGAADLERELAEARAREAALAEVLRSMSSSPTDVQPVLDAIATSAARFCGAEDAWVMLEEEGELRLAAHVGPVPFTRPFSYPIDRESMNGRAFIEGRVLSVSDIQTAVEYPRGAEQGVKYGWHSSLVAPLMRGATAIGTIALRRIEIQPFSDRQIELLVTFADQAVIALENVRLSAATNAALERQIAVSQILEAMSRSTKDLSLVFTTIIRNVVLLGGADNASIFRADGDVYRHVASATSSGRFADEASFAGLPEEAASGWLVKDRSTVVGRVLIEKATVQILDTLADTEYDNTRGLDFIIAMAGRPARTILGVPIVKGAALLGVIIARRNEVRAFTEREINVLETFARQAAIAIENTRLFSETKEALERQTAIADILRSIAGSPADIRPVLQSIAESAVRYCGAEDVVVQLIRDGELQSLAHHGNMVTSGAPSQISRASISGSAVIEGRTIHVPDLLAPSAAQYESARARAQAGGFQNQAVLAAPLKREGKAVGSILIRKSEPIPFTDTQITLLESFADQAVIAIENVRLFNETKEALAQQTAVAEILSVISSSPTDIEPVLKAVAERAIRLCEAEDSLINVVRGDELPVVAHVGKVPVHRATTDEDAHPLTPDWITGRAAIEGRTIHVVDASLVADEFPRSFEWARRYGFGTVLAAPLLRKGAALGVLTLRRPEVRPFTDRQVTLLETFADQAAIAIENVRLFNETREALEQQIAVSEVLDVIGRSTRDREPVFEIAAKHALRLCEAEHFALWEVHGQSIELAYSTNPPFRDTFKDGLWPIEADTILGQAIITKTVVHVADVLELPQYRDPAHSAGISQRAGGSRRMMAAPLLRGDEVVGAIGMSSRTPGPFTETQVRLVRIFADQVLIAIENVRLFNETKEALEQQTAISEVLEVISRTSNDLKPVFQAVLEKALVLCEADNAGLALREGETYRQALDVGFTPQQEAITARFPAVHFGRVVRAGDRSTLTGRVAEAGRTILIPDVAADSEWEPEVDRSLVPATSMLGVPLLREGDVVGVMILRRFGKGSFAERHIQLVETFAHQASIAIENVRLFNETKETLERETATAEVLRVTARSTFELQPVLDAVIANATRLAGAENGFVYQVDGEVLRMTAAVGEKAELMREWQRTNPIRANDRGTATGRAFVEARTVHLPDVFADPEYHYWEAQHLGNFRTLLSVPLVRQGTAVGVIAMWRTEEKPFTEKEINLVETFADQAVIAIENVRLINEIQDKSRQLEVASKHKSEFLANMSHELRTPLNAIIGFSEVMLERMFGELNARQDEYLHDILSSGRHLLTLINDILDLAKIEAGRTDLEPGVFSLRTALENGVTMVRERASRHGIAVDMEIGADLESVSGDERKVKQVVYNLLSNAVKFTPDGGRVDIHAARENGAVQVTVRDTGIGIALDDQARIFEEFSQVGRDPERSREGTGLGLTLAKRYVELHGGRLWVESAPGQGSAFTFTLPQP